MKSVRYCAITYLLIGALTMQAMDDNNNNKKRPLDNDYSLLAPNLESRQQHQLQNLITDIQEQFNCYAGKALRSDIKQLKRLISAHPGSDCQLIVTQAFLGILENGNKLNDPHYVFYTPELVKNIKEPRIKDLATLKFTQQNLHREAENIITLNTINIAPQFTTQVTQAIHNREEGYFAKQAFLKYWKTEYTYVKENRAASEKELKGFDDLLEKYQIIGAVLLEQEKETTN